jgi:hypothetical protein
LEASMDLRRRCRIIPIVLLAIFMIAPVVAMAQVAWVKSFSAAVKQASKEKKFIVLDVSATW